jgi:glycogen operon protein
MLTAGDEFGRTQAGNNNAYCQDNETTWLDWKNRDRALEDHVADLAARRAANANYFAAFKHDANWLTLDGRPMSADDWERPDSAGMKLETAERDSKLALTVDRPARRVDFSLA